MFSLGFPFRAPLGPILETSRIFLCLMMTMKFFSFLVYSFDTGSLFQLIYEHLR